MCRGGSCEPGPSVTLPGQRLAVSTGGKQMTVSKAHAALCGPQGGHFLWYKHREPGNRPPRTLLARRPRRKMRARPGRAVPTKMLGDHVFVSLGEGEGLDPSPGCAHITLLQSYTWRCSWSVHPGVKHFCPPFTGRWDESVGQGLQPPGQQCPDQCCAIEFSVSAEPSTGNVSVNEKGHVAGPLHWTAPLQMGTCARG